ncbi:MAG: MFS transporter [Syntrophomonas sp.]
MPPLVVLGLAEFVRGALVLSLLPMYGQYAAGYSLEIIGTAISLQYLLDNLFRIPAGWLNDRFGGKWLLMAGISLLGSGVYIMYAHWNIALFFLGAGLFGLGFTPVWPVVVATISSRMPAAQMGEALSTVFMAWLIGGGLGPVMINFIIGHSYRLAFSILLAELLIALFFAIIGDFPPVVFKVISPSNSLKELLHEAFSLKIIYPGMVMQTMALGILGPIIAVYARMVFGLSTEQFNLFLVGGGIFTVVLLIPAGKLTDRWGYKIPLNAGLLLAAIGLIILPLQKVAVYALISGSFIGIAYALILPSWNGVLGRVVSPDKRGTMWAIFMTLEGLGMAAGSYIGGKVWEGWGHGAPFFISSFIMAAMAIFYTINDIDQLVNVNNGN